MTHSKSLQIIADALTLARQFISIRPSESQEVMDNMLVEALALIPDIEVEIKFTQKLIMLTGIKNIEQYELWTKQSLGGIAVVDKLPSPPARAEKE